MEATMATVYVKPRTAPTGSTKYYVGHRPSNQSQSPSYRIGGFFVVTSSFGYALSVAKSEARRIEADVVICPEIFL
jgi:hypothetical protein